MCRSRLDRRSQSVWAGALALLLAGLLLCLPVRAQQAVWVWEEDTEAMLASAEQAEQAIAFFKRQGIDTVYLYADAHGDKNGLLEQPHRHAQLIARLHAQGLQVHALLGSWPLHTERYILPEYRAQALAMVQRVLDYNRDAPAPARFDGINLDIEPHVLDDWSSKREAYLAMFLDLSEAWMALKRRANQSLQIGPAMVFWLDGIEVRHAGKLKPASEHLQDIYDHVVLMDYRNRAFGPDGILSHAQDELAYARRIGKKVMIGVETAPNALAKLTFHGLPPAQMPQELDLVRQALRGDRAFGGFVIHHFRSYRRLLAP